MIGKQPETGSEVELKSLIGKHILSGVDFESHNEKIYERVNRILIETHSDLKDEIQDNPNCTLIANKKLVEIVNKLHDFIEEYKLQ